jgi:hypothetical protein
MLAILRGTIYTNVTQPGFRRISLGVPREVGSINKYLEIPWRTAKVPQNVNEQTNKCSNPSMY